LPWLFLEFERPGGAGDVDRLSGIQNINSRMEIDRLCVGHGAQLIYMATGSPRALVPVLDEISGRLRWD